MFFVYCGISLALVLFAGLASGLTIGLLSLDDLQLSVLAKTGSEVQKKQVKRLKAVVSNHHLLLVTLLLWNAAAMETLPLFLDKLVPSWVAIILSVTFVLIFGEVLPQSIFTGKYKMALSSALVPVVRVLQFLIFVIAWPIAKLLDRVLGHSDDTYFRKRQQLKALIELHATERHAGLPLTEDEVKIIKGCLDLIEDKAGGPKMTPWNMVYKMRSDAILNAEMREALLASGFSRIPIFADGDENNIIGLLIIKRLIGVDLSGPERRIDEIVLRRPLVVHPQLPLLKLLNDFQRGVSHLALVSEHAEKINMALNAIPPRPIDPAWVILGIVSLEDVLEELIDEEIEDEDEFDRCQHQRAIETVRRCIAGRQRKKMRLEKLGQGYIFDDPLRERNRGFQRHHSEASMKSPTEEIEVVGALHRIPSAPSPAALPAVFEVSGDGKKTKKEKPQELSQPLLGKVQQASAYGAVP